ncbi:MAG: phage tail family protein [Butyrivibrio sp.]|nr:phage tail family protein [Acetatifactor muris]MCM1560963.1 phage tail family protein [Butyrivibrio sp.]
MVTDRKIIISKGSISLELTSLPYTVERAKGFDRLQIQNITSQGFDQDGASLVNSYVLPRDMEIIGQMQAATTYQMQQLRDNLINIFLPKTELTITHFYGGVTRLLTARVEKSPQFEFTEVSAVQNYLVSLTATEPYWRDKNETLVEIANVTGRFHFPLIIPKDKGVCFGIKQKSLIADVFNKSVIKTGIKVTFTATGEVKNPLIFNINTREYLKLLCNMEAGEKITVETGQNNTVTREKSGLVEDYIGKVDLQGGGCTFLELDPGDNILRCGADEGEDMLETRIYFYNRYMGV